MEGKTLQQLRVIQELTERIAVAVSDELEQAIEQLEEIEVDYGENQSTREPEG